MNSARRYVTTDTNPAPYKRSSFPKATAASDRIPMGQVTRGNMVGRIRRELADGHWSSAGDVTGWVRSGAPSTSTTTQSRVLPSNYKLFTQPIIGEAVPDAGDFLFSLITSDGRISESIGGSDPTLHTTSTKAGNLASLNYYLMQHQTAVGTNSEIGPDTQLKEIEILSRIIDSTSLHGVVVNEHGTDGRETALTNGGARELALGRMEIPNGLRSIRSNAFKLAGRISNSRVDRILMVTREGSASIKNVFSKELRAGDNVHLVLKRMKMPAKYVLDAKPLTKETKLTPGDAMHNKYFQYAFVTTRAGQKLPRSALEYEYKGHTYLGKSQYVGFVLVLEPHARHDKNSTYVSDTPVAFSDASIGHDKQMLQLAFTPYL